MVLDQYWLLIIKLNKESNDLFLFIRFYHCTNCTSKSRTKEKLYCKVSLFLFFFFFEKQSFFISKIRDMWKSWIECKLVACGGWNKMSMVFLDNWSWNIIRSYNLKFVVPIILKMFTRPSYNIKIWWFSSYKVWYGQRKLHLYVYFASNNKKAKSRSSLRQLL